jgi:hypothetical protein
LEFLGDSRGGFFLLKGKFGMGVKVLIEIEEVGVSLIDLGLDLVAKRTRILRNARDW